MHIYDVAVIGAGPAGIAASAYAHRLGLDTLLVYSLFGGQLNYTHKLHSVISASDIKCASLIKLYSSLVHRIDKRNDCRISGIQKENDLFTIEGNSSSFRARTVIVCTGRSPTIPKFEEYKDRIYSFLDYPYSAVEKEDDILIIGGGYTGLDICETLARKVNSITVVEKSNRLGGNRERQVRVRQKRNVTILIESMVRFVGDSPDIVSVFSNGNYCSKIKFSKLFACIGTCPDTAFLDKRLLNGNNEFIINKEHNQKHNENMSPFIKGLFAAGDIIARPITGYAAVAESSGLEAAVAAYNYLLDEGIFDDRKTTDGVAKASIRRN